MEEMVKAIFAWSGGKDSAFALNHVLEEGKYEIMYLLTTLNKDLKRVSMHGVKEELLDLQAQSIGIPLLKVWVSEGSYEEYETQMENTLLKAKEEAIREVVFGDIFLEDLREYREKNIAKIGMKASFPLWKKDTKKIIGDFIDKGFQTISCCVNDAFFSEKEVGELINNDFLDRLPIGVDSCGENGEYHTFCFDGPIFKKKIKFQVGEKVYKSLDEKYIEDKPNATKGFWFVELDTILDKQV